MVDINTVAGSYTTVAAVLAGFAFSGLILLLTVRMFPDAAPRLPSSYPATVRALLAAFISLALVATNYAYLSGVKNLPGPAASHAVLYGQAFAIAALQLVYATLLTLATAESSGGQRFGAGGVFSTFQKVVVGALAPFVAFSSFAGVTEYRELHPGDEDALKAVLLATCCIVVAFAVVWFARRSWRRSGTWARPIPPMAGGATAAVALMTLTTFTASFNPTDPCATATSGVLVVMAAVTGVAIVVLTWAIARFRMSDAGGLLR